MKNNYLYGGKLFDKGDVVLISKKPETWSSGGKCGVRYPLDLNFPIEITVESCSIRDANEDFFINIIDTNGFGWTSNDYFKLIRKGNVEFEIY